MEVLFIITTDDNVDVFPALKFPPVSTEVGGTSVLPDREDASVMEPIAVDGAHAMEAQPDFSLIFGGLLLVSGVHQCTHYHATLLP